MQNSSVATGDALPGKELPLSAHHRRELLIESAIDEQVARERGYATVGRPTATLKDAYGRDTREQLAAMGFPAWSTREDYYFPGLHIPQYTPSGTRYAGQWKPSRPVVPKSGGKPMRYASAKGAARLDVHPRWSTLCLDALVPPIVDITRRLWVTEGVKKADALTSRGEVTVALAGVYNWRNTHGGLADWEDVPLKAREVVVCFDSDAITKPAVARAMERLGKWLRYKGAAKVWYCVVPPAVNDNATKGVDDFFAAGGTMKELERAFETKPPQVTDTEDRFTDARLAETLATEVLDGTYIWTSGTDWLAWNGKVWKQCSEVTVLEAVRQWALTNHAEAVSALRLDDKAAAGEVDGWRGLLSASRARTVLSLARGIVERQAEEFDSDPDMLNTPGGMVRLSYGEVFPHDPDALCTKITSGNYVPGFRHPDWDRALEVLPEETMTWMQTRIGQALTGYTTPDGVVPILRSGGESGKSLLTTDGVLPAIGGYGMPASAKLFEKKQHSTEQVALRGQRLVVAEELTEGRSIDVSALKRVADVGRLTAREVNRNNVTFDATHSLFATTNYRPVVNEVDHGTWRRMVLVEFPYTYLKPGETITDPATQRRGDPTLKDRINRGKTGQHDAIVTWAVEGARRWYAGQAAIEKAVANGTEPPPSALTPPPAVVADTRSWRAEADRILGYWEQCLEPAEGCYVLTVELVEHFNRWLAQGGHTPWSKETFHPRFRDHMETKRHGVVYLQQRRSASIGDHVVRTPSAAIHAPLKARIDVAQGLRWRIDEE